MRNHSVTVCGAAMFLSLLVSSAFGYDGKEIEELSAKMATKIADKGKKTVAVVDFTDLQGNVTQLDQFIAEEFSVALAGSSKGFRVIDRTRLKSIIKENKLAATGLIDPATASKLGKIAGVDALVTGTLTPFGDTVHLTVKVLDSNTADVIDSAKSDIAKTPAINELLGKEIVQEKPAQERDATDTKKKEGGLVQEVKGFTFNVKECKKSGDFVACSVSITSINKDRNIGFYVDHGNNGSSFLYDDRGYEHTARIIQIGEQKDNYTLSRRFVANVPTITSFEFKGVNQSVNMVALFEITCRVENEQFSVQFRNIPISK